MKQRGFTLLETIIYLALFTIIIGGGMVATHNIIEGTSASYNHIVLQEEANFLFRKIGSALNGALGIEVPSPQMLHIIISPTPGVPKNGVSVNGTDMTLWKNIGSTVPPPSEIVLNSASITVSGVSFIDIPTQNGKPQGVIIAFTLTTAQHGRIATQNFSTTKYLRQ